MDKHCCRPGQHSSLPLDTLGFLLEFHGKGSFLGPHLTPPRHPFLPTAPLNHHWADPGSAFRLFSFAFSASPLLELFSHLQNPGHAPELLCNCLGFLKEEPQALLFHRRGSEPAGPHFINIRRDLRQPSVKHSPAARFQLLLALPSDKKTGFSGNGLQVSHCSFMGKKEK